ncbi:MAG: hypothetical protein ACFB50_01880 [Rubrobacteraceae bacterium]
MFAAWVSALSVVAGAITLYFFGLAYATALLYGVCIGLMSFVSTAATTSLLTGRSTAKGMAIGGASFGARLGFAAGALGIPTYLNLWPAVTMMVAFAAVYVAENVLLIPVLLGKGRPGNQDGEALGYRMERRAKV